MSRIGELIAELCPDGVPLKELGEVGLFIRGRRFTKADYVEAGLGAIHYGEIYTEYGTGAAMTRSFVRPELKSTLRLAKTGDLVIAATGENVKDLGRAVAWIGSDEIAIHDDCYIFRHALEPKYVSYFFQSSEFHGQKVKFASESKVVRLSGANLAKIKMPVPPLEVQREIVRILDTFSALEAELEAELEARRRQYAFYWRALLTPGGGWQRKTLGEIADLFDGPHATPRKTDSGPWYLSISSLKGGQFDLGESAHLGTDQYDAWTRRVAPRVGDTMFSYETRLGQAAYWDIDEPAALGRRMGLLRPRESAILPRFLTLAYLGPEFQSLIQAKTVHGATVDRIPIADMPSWPISIPPASEQKRIVAILDKFDALVNDLSIGLPAELAARRAQYEHYRDRLLTFSEAA